MGWCEYGTPEELPNIEHDGRAGPVAVAGAATPFRSPRVTNRVEPLTVAAAAASVGEPQPGQTAWATSPPVTATLTRTWSNGFSDSS